MGLAAVALIGGLLLAVVNVLVGDDDALADASPTPGARQPSTPLPTPTERPPMVFSVQPGVPDLATFEDRFSGWIRAQSDVPLLTDPSPDALPIGTLSSGALAYADTWADDGTTKSGWLHVVAPAPTGWIATPLGGADPVERFSQGQVPGSAYVWDVVAGAAGFVAVATPPTAGVDSVPLMFSSADGRRWRASSTQLFDPSYGYGGPAIAWGPVGWLAIAPTSSPNGPLKLWLWQSADGVGWRPLGTMASLADFAYPTRLVGSDDGYLLSVDQGRDRQRGRTSSLFASRDGLTWRESEDPGFVGEPLVQIAAIPTGFIAWDAAFGTAHQHVFYSVDGRTWSAADGPMGGGVPDGGLQVTALKDKVIATEVDPGSSATHVWLGAADGPRFNWVHDEDADEAFRGAIVTKLVSDGLRAVALGWEISTDEAIAWTLNSDGWSRSALPEAFNGGIPRMAAGGPGGIVLVANRPTLRGPNPIFWHRVAGGGWRPEESPIFDVIPDRVGRCGAPPADALSFNLTDQSTAVACFGASPITFRAWSAPCEGCYGTDAGREPAWLQGGEQQLYLSPIVDRDWGGTNAIIDPSLAYDPAWVESWVEVTGHFDDPMAAGCTWVPNPDQFSYYDGQRGVIDECRRQFVVTAVTIVDGP